MSKTVGDILAGRPLHYVRAEWTVHRAVRTMADRRVGAVCVLQDERVVGIFSERDLMTRVALPRRDLETTRVAEVMTRDIVVASPRDTIVSCLHRMGRGGFRHLPIVEEGRLVGFVSFRELLQFDLDEKSVEIRAMTDYIRYTPGPGGDEPED